MIQTNALLTIEKLSPKPLDFIKLELNQCFNDHHRLKIVLDLERIGEDVLGSPLQKATLINEKVIVDIFAGKDLVHAYTFSGLITDVQIELDNGGHGRMHIFAASLTIELERGKMMQTFSDTDLESIVEEVTQGLIHLYHIKIDPKYKNPVKFSMQYRETDFQYLRRLAWMYGEKFFYSGEVLVFGEHKSLPAVKATYDKDLTEVKICTKLIPNTFQQYYHDIDFVKSPFEYNLSEGGTFAGEANAKSAKLNYGKKPNLPLDVPVFDDGSLREITKMRKERNCTDMFHVTGRSKLYKICIGGLLEIDFGKLKVDDGLGLLRVISTRHVFDETGHYFNEFEAVSEKFGRVPFPEINFPVANAIPAKVVANEDPDGLGRIQVKFDFETRDCDYWMPLLVPDGGGNPEIGKKKNRGFICIPEVKDKVLVSFLDSNPEFPFILGSMFHGGNSSQKHQGGGIGNHVRSISDKSNNFIQMNSNEGVKMQDRGGNSAHLDGAGNFVAATGNTVVMNVGGSQGPQGETPSVLMMDKSGNISLTGTSNITLKVGKNTIIIDSKGITLTNKDGNSISITLDGITKTAKAGKIETVAEAGSVSIASDSDEISLTASTKIDVIANDSVNLSATEVNSN